MKIFADKTVKLQFIVVAGLLFGLVLAEWLVALGMADGYKQSMVRHDHALAGYMARSGMDGRRIGRIFTAEKTAADTKTGRGLLRAAGYTAGVEDSLMPEFSHFYRRYAALSLALSLAFSAILLAALYCFALHLLGALDFPTSGRVVIDGRDIFSLKEEELAVFRRRHIGFIFQAYNLVPELNVEENIILPLLLDGKEPDRKYLDELLGILGLADRKHHLPNQLSGGQQQRVAIGRALVTRPAIILADEPTGNLDSKNSKDVIDLLRLSVDRYRQTVIMVTHNPAYASIADRVLNVVDGVVTELGGMAG